MGNTHKKDKKKNKKDTEARHEFAELTTEPPPVPAVPLDDAIDANAMHFSWRQRWDRRIRKWMRPLHMKWLVVRHELIVCCASCEDDEPDVL